jgi:FMN reductase
VIPEQIAVGQAWKIFGPDGKLLDDTLSQRFDRFTESLLESTQRLHPAA